MSENHKCPSCNSTIYPATYGQTIYEGKVWHSDCLKRDLERRGVTEEIPFEPKQIIETILPHRQGYKLRYAYEMENSEIDFVPREEKSCGDLSSSQLRLPLEST